MGETVIEESSSILEKAEPGFDQRPLPSPRFTAWAIEIEVIERPVVARFTIHENNWLTATPLKNLFVEAQGVEVRSAGKNLDVNEFERLHIDCRPDVDLSFFDFQFLSWVEDCW